MLHKYEANDIASCLNSQRILFVGDSTVRQVFWAAARKLAKHDADKHKERAQKHSSYSYTRRNVTLEFWWDPFLNSTALKVELRSRHNQLEGVLPSSIEQQDGGTAMLLGTGLWHARHLGHEALQQFQRSINDTVAEIWSQGSNFSQRHSRISAANGVRDRVLIAPVEAPLYEKLSPDRGRALVPGVIEEMNLHLEQLSLHHGVPTMWAFKDMTSGRIAAYEESGVHVTDVVVAQRADVLFNMLCNTKAAQAGVYPLDGTCCVLPKAKSLWRASLAVWIVVFVRLTSNAALSWPGLTVLLAAGFASMADRTPMFNKVQKQYSEFDFLVLTGVGFLLGFLTVQPSSSSSRRRWCDPSNGLQSFLSRDQTDEWKGWMQLVILVYHYTGASKELWIYKAVRVLVASYLFLTGYGHTKYFYEKDDYSFRRVAAVLIRLNLLSCILPYIMSTEYIFYYFAPLASFWFLVVYAILRIDRSHNHLWQFLTAKILVSAVLVSAFLHTPGLLEAVFTFLRTTCRIHWSVYEVRFRFGLDQYIVFVGMLTAVIHTRITLARSSIRQKEGPAFDPAQRHSFFLPLLVATFATTVLVGYSIVAWRFPNKFDYNLWHPYISLFPILAYAILRNSHPVLAAYHSRAFAWLGRCSLETFTLQYHIWLAGDTKGLLSTGLFRGDGTFFGDRWRDSLLLTPIFLFVSWKVSNATMVITNLIVKDAEANASQGGFKSDTLKLPEHNSKCSHTTPSNSGGYLYSIFGRLGRILWPGNLRVRILILLGVMWVCNWTTSPAQRRL